MKWFGPVVLLAKAEVRGRRATIAIIVLVAALVSGATLTTAAGARRTATVVDRMVAQTDRSDYAIGTYLTTDAGDPALLRAAEAAIVDVPGVDRAMAIANIAIPLGPEDGSWYFSIGTNLDGRYLESGWAPPVREGRLPAVDGKGEVAFDPETAERLDLRVGDEFVAPTISIERVEALMSGRETEIVPDGPELRFEVVGIFRRSVTDDPSFGFGLASPDTAAYLGRAGVTEAYFEFDGAPDIDVQAAVRAVEGAIGSGQAYSADPDIVLEPVRDTVDIIAVGLALFAGIAAVAGLIALGQVTGRQVADGGRSVSVTGALGMRDREIAVALALPSVVSAGVGIVAGAIASAGLSPIFPTGIGRRAEPDPGVRVDWLVLTVGTLVLIVVVSVSAIVVARRSVRTSDRATRTVVRRRRSGLRRGLPLPAAVGSGLVLVSNRFRTAVRPASALLGTVLGVTGVLAIAVFTVSQQTTADEPARYGWTWDVDSDLAVDDPETLVRALAEEPALEAVGVAWCGQSRIGEDDLPLCAMEVLSGSMPLTYLDGRAPTSPDEMAAGEVTFNRLDLAIGDDVEITGSSGVSRNVEIVGIAVFPDTSSPGNGLVTTPEGLQSLSGEEQFPILTLRYAAGLDDDEVERVLADDYGLSPDELTRASPPELVQRLELVRPTLVALAVFLGVIGVIGLVHFLMLSTVRRRHETAVLEALGFVRSQTIAIVIWQALTIASIGLIVGAPLGVMLGRSVWVESVDHLGIVDTATVPWAFCALVGTAVLLGAAMVGLVTGWGAARRRPSVALHPE